jgi:hypothetical protein
MAYGLHGRAAMSSHLLPCPACSRHVRATEPRCPFCSSCLPSSFATRPAPLRAPPGLSRGRLHSYLARSSALQGLLLVGASALTLGCGDRSELPLGPCAPPSAPPEQPSGGGVPVPLYGAGPAFDPPQCQGDVAVSSSKMDDGQLCSCSGGRQYLLCVDGYYTKCSCGLPRGYIDCTNL